MLIDPAVPDARGPVPSASTAGSRTASITNWNCSLQPRTLLSVLGSTSIS